MNNFLNSSCTLSWRNLGLLSFAAVFLLGCGSQSRVSEGPVVPEDQLEAMEVALQFPPISNLEHNTVQVPYSDIKIRSTVVISHGNVGGNSSKSAAGIVASIDNDAALAIAKEEIQKQLIRSGFRVLDQQQVNAQLIELGMNKPCGNRQFWWQCTTYLNDNEVAYLNGLRAKLEAGQLQQQKYSQEMQKSRDEWQRRATTLNATLSAIRAQQLAADYILEIREFDARQVVSQTINLGNVADVGRFLRGFPEVSAQFADKQFLTCTGLGSQMKARLVNTVNSEVVWLGGHTISEMNDPGNHYLLELGVRRVVSNRDEVRQYIEDNRSMFRKNKVAEGGLQWQYRSELVGPKLIQGICNPENRQSEITRRISNELTGQVSRDLVSTIKIAGQVIPAAQPTFRQAAPEVSTGTKSEFLKNSIGPIQTNR